MNDNDIRDALGKLLSDPEALSGIMSTASALLGGASAQPVADTPQSTLPQPTLQQAESPTVKDSENATAAPLGGLDLASLAGLFGAAVKDDPRCNLLYALRPFLSRERAEKIDGLVKAMKLANAAEKLLSNNGIL